MPYQNDHVMFTTMSVQLQGYHGILQWKMHIISFTKLVFNLWHNDTTRNKSKMIKCDFWQVKVLKWCFKLNFSQIVRGKFPKLFHKICIISFIKITYYYIM